MSEEKIVETDTTISRVSLGLSLLVSPNRQVGTRCVKKLIVGKKDVCQMYTSSIGAGKGGVRTYTRRAGTIVLEKQNNRLSISNVGFVTVDEMDALISKQVSSIFVKKLRRR